MFCSLPRPRTRRGAGQLTLPISLTLLLATGLLLGCVVSPSFFAAEAPLRISPRPALITVKAQVAIKRGLAWLARNQARDGSWRSTGMRGGYPTVMTSLAGLALMAGGNTPVEGRYAKNVRLAVDFILRQARPSGLISSLSEEHHSMYGHGFALLFLAEAYGMEADQLRQRHIQRVLRNGVQLTVRSQSRQGGWLYTPESRSDEGSVTVTQIQGLRACRNAGIKVPKKTIDRAGEYIRKCAQKDGGISYRVGQGGSRPPITAAAVATLYNAGQYENPVAIGALKYSLRLLKKNQDNPWRVYRGHTFYGMLYLSQALWVSGDKNWTKYFPKIREGLLARQTKSGSWQGDNTGYTYGTAIALFILQLPYQYLPIVQR